MQPVYSGHFWSVHLVVAIYRLLNNLKRKNTHLDGLGVVIINIMRVSTSVDVPEIYLRVNSQVNGPESIWLYVQQVAVHLVISTVKVATV